MNAAYPTAAIPEPFQILGLRLKPLCLGHYLHMARFNVAFAAAEIAQATLQDLVMGVLICSRSYEEFLEFLQQPDLRAQLEEWGKQAGHAFDIPEKIHLFRRYIDAHMEEPIVVYEQESRPSNAHWAQTLKLSLISIGYTAPESLNLPISQAFADFYKHAENLGLVTILSDEEAAFLRDDVEEASPLPSGTPEVRE